MKIAYITSGAAGMYCGTCMHDNALAATMIQLGHDVTLMPVYTPLRTDEQDVTIDRVFFGALNVFLQQKLALFRHTPWILDRLLDRPKLLNWVSRFSVSTDARDLGALTQSMLEGEDGLQRKELEKLIVWLERDLRPELVHLSHSLFLGFAHQLKERLGVPVVCSLQGEDLFFDELIEPHRSRILRILRHKAKEADAFTAPCGFYADKMSELLEIDRRSIHQLRLGIHVEDFAEHAVDTNAEPLVIGYLARICPEKGLHLLVEAFAQLCAELGKERLLLRIAGYVGGRDAAYLEEQKKRLAAWGLSDRVEVVGEVDRRGKVAFLRSLDLFSVPTVYQEPKGLYVLEALASGVPVVLPRHGSFPELIAATGGGLLVEPQSAPALASALRSLIEDGGRRAQLARQGRQKVLEDYNHRVMAEETLALYQRLLADDAPTQALTTRSNELATVP